jgi:hypothetical protein
MFLFYGIVRVGVCSVCGWRSRGDLKNRKVGLPGRGGGTEEGGTATAACEACPFVAVVMVGDNDPAGGRSEGDCQGRDNDRPRLVAKLPLRSGASSAATGCITPPLF